MYDDSTDLSARELARIADLQKLMQRMLAAENARLPGVVEP